ncbi:hypothetical protein ACTFIU_003086 [Dictyostelium citrinum]
MGKYYQILFLLYLLCILYVISCGYINPYSPYSSPCLFAPIIGYLYMGGSLSSNSSNNNNNNNNNSNNNSNNNNSNNYNNNNNSNNSNSNNNSNNNDINNTIINNKSNNNNDESKLNENSNNNNDSKSNIKNKQHHHYGAFRNRRGNKNSGSENDNCTKCNKRHHTQSSSYDTSELHQSVSSGLGGSMGSGSQIQTDIEKDINEFMNANPSHSLNKQQIQQQQQQQQQLLEQQQLEKQRKEQEEIEKKKQLEKQQQQQQQQFQQKQQQNGNLEEDMMQEGRILKNVSKVYRDVNENQPKSYYDYESYRINWKNVDRYEVIQKIGRGKYSEVFSGIDTETGDEVVIKVLKPVQKLKIQREIKILESLDGGPNIIPLLDAVKDQSSKVCSLVFPFVNKTDIRELVYTLEDYDIRYYIFELLKAIDYTHSKGIIHRDIKPLNIAIDHSQRKLSLIDWGLAEYYHPGKNYNVRVASRHYKPPELLVNMYDYDYSLDMWSLGCLFAGLILDRDPFFNGDNNNDQLLKIVKVLGTDDLFNFLDKFGLSLTDEQSSLIKPRQKSNWERFIPYENDDIAQPDAIDFLDKLLRYDPTERLTAKEAMKHPYFKDFNQSIL